MGKSLPSYVLADGLSKVGSRVAQTIDLMSAIGTVVVMHPDPKVVQEDLSFIRHMEKINGFFTFKENKIESSSPIPQPIKQKINTCGVDDDCSGSSIEVINFKISICM